MYHLSNRQKKELKNGKILQIALPHPPGDELPDPLDWAKDHLDCAPQNMIAADVEMVAVDPFAGVAETLSEDFGAIVQPDAIAKKRAPLLHVECVVCTLAMRRADRGRYPVRWPAQWTEQQKK